MQQPKPNRYLVFILVFINVAFGALNSVLSSAYLPDIVKDINSTNVENIAGWINASFLAAFCMFNRYVDGLGATTPDDPAFYELVGKQRAEEGYMNQIETDDAVVEIVNRRSYITNRALTLLQSQRHIYCKAAFGRFFVFKVHVFCSVPHGFNNAIQ
jgi:hypothetical protein